MLKNTASFLSIMFLFVSAGLASDSMQSPAECNFTLFSDSETAEIIIDSEDSKVVHTAGECFIKDLKTVSGRDFDIRSSMPQMAENVVLIGSAGKSSFIDQLISEEKFDSSTVAQQQWESFVLSVVEEPFEGVYKALVIAGSDPRGTAFGVFELSEMMGVSPWVWWADVPADHRNEFQLSDNFYKTDKPDVKYRGIFINDEDWGLHPWAANTFEDEYGYIGPKTYSKVFELLLRLKANHIWPAMHACSTPFYQLPENKRAADKYGIVIGSSHCEPLLFNNAAEWDSSTDGIWDYTQNSERIKEVLDQRVETAASNENIYTVGIRGMHDTGMSGADSLEEGASILEDVIADEREILSRHIDKPVSEIPQVFVPYKEVLDYYDAGLDLPEDITLMWAEDNFGYIKRFSDSSEQQRNGGGGVYYHLSYLGVPHPYLLLYSTSPSLVWREMNRAWQMNMRGVWIVNVGDLKRREWHTEFFLQMSWDINRWTKNNITEYFKTAASRDIGQEYADDIASIMERYTALANQRKPELMGFNKHWAGRRELNDPDFALFTHSDRSAERIEKYKSLRRDSQEIFDNLPESAKDAYFQLVHYPAVCAASINEKILYAYKSREYARQGRAIANYYAAQAESAFERIKELTRIYNEDIAEGKWNKVTSWHPLDSDVFLSPNTAKPDLSGQGELGVCIEGSPSQLDTQANYPNQSLDTLVFHSSDAELYGEDIEIGSDSSGSYISVPEGRGRDLSFPTENRADFSFEIPAAAGGLYKLCAVIEHPNPDADSWFIKMEGRPHILWNDNVGRGKYHITDFELSEGQHTLSFYAREDGARLRGVMLLPPSFNFLPKFNRYTDKEYFIDIFSKGQQQVSWQASASDSWIKLSESSGTLSNKDHRIWVSIDYADAPKKDNVRGSIDITSEGKSFTVNVSAFNKYSAAVENSFVEDRGVIAFNAESYSAKRSRGSRSWEVLEGLGRTGASMVLEPLTGWYVENIGNVRKSSPYLEYDIKAASGGAAVLNVYAVPSFSLKNGKKLRCAVSIDGNKPFWIEFEMGKDGSALWQENVASGIIKSSEIVEIAPGNRKLRIWGTDPSINIDKIEIDFGGLVPSYLGADQTETEEFSVSSDFFNLLRFAGSWLEDGRVEIM
ncbi:hypothetical protein L21SP3_01192 [Sedimentisphaera cyanobacteriorum]|uniref:Gylcosyl hydrolase 115 C-terminal domain-containing protein n=1 Tax=Sedimentisphaera cyanobacteriorum TaxID=1940790 RepID=A0A1Q2HPN7_9BACT|nr:glycosyl hydrolase 115 family protein [Sedimentisphaera cyanobacteriorum]AQQ09388.1 hypothetical protein L21SP3_01192 [Sedimentisphaera cyanobacteriorum]